MLKVGCWTAVCGRQLFLRTCLMQMRLQARLPDEYLILINGEDADSYDQRCIDDLLQPWISVQSIPRKMTPREASALAVDELLRTDVDLFCKIDSDDIYRVNYLKSILDEIESRRLMERKQGFCLNLVNQLWFNADSSGGATIHNVVFRYGLGLTDEEKARGMRAGAPPTFVFDRRVAEILVACSRLEPYVRDRSDDRAWRRILLDHGIIIDQVGTPERVFGYLRHSANTCTIKGQVTNSQNRPATHGFRSSERATTSRYTLCSPTEMVGELPGSPRLTPMFLNLGIGRERTGIENAALMRARIFENYLGIVPQILTVAYDAHFAETHAELLREKAVSPNTVFRNIYDECQEFGPHSGSYDRQLAPKKSLAIAPVPSRYTEKAVAGTPDTRVYDENGQCVLYRKHSRQTGVLQYINFLHKGRRWRRDTFTPSGHLSRVQYLDPATGEALFEHYLRPDGSVAIVQLYTLVGGKRQLAKISLLDRDGHFQNEFATQEEFVTFWLDRITTCCDQQFLMVSDKNRVYYRSLLRLKQSGRKRNLVIIPVIHAVHTKDGFRIETSGTNFNYADILDDIHKPDAIVVGTQQQQDDIVKRYGGGRLHVIPPACNERQVATDVPFAARNRTEVVYLGRYSEEKNHHLAVRAFVKVVDAIPSATLQMYGSGSAKDAIKQAVEQLGLQNSVFVNDYVQDVPGVLRRAGLSILTSKGEGYPLVIMESMSYGCPVVAFDVRYGPADMIDDGVSGVLVPFGDTDALAEQIVQILLDPIRHRQMCDMALYASQRFTPTHIAAAWRRLIQEQTLLVSANAVC